MNRGLKLPAGGRLEGNKNLHCEVKIQIKAEKGVRR